eukprot:jgi/Botrbrau1/4988/Bobra.0396s0014.1
MHYIQCDWTFDQVADLDAVYRPADGCPDTWQVVLDYEPFFARNGVRRLAGTLGWTPLHAAAVAGNVVLIKELLSTYNCNLLEPSASSWMPLHYAAALNKVPAMEELIRLGCPAAVRDEQLKLTPLHVAACEGHMDAVNYLLEKGQDIDTLSGERCTPLYCAAEWHQTEMVRHLSVLGCNPIPGDARCCTPVHVAALQGWSDLLAVLINELGQKVDSVDDKDLTPLHAAASNGHVEAIRLLLSFMHSLECKDKTGRTALHHAALNVRVAAVEELLKQGANITAMDLDGYTPLHAAADGGCGEVIQMLVSKGADINATAKEGLTPLGVATFKGPANLDAVATLVRLHANVASSLRVASLESPLHLASRSGRADVAKLLVAAGVPVTVRSKDGSTPLHYAAAFGQAHMIKVLTDLGCDANIKDNAQNSPLHIAAGCGFLETVVQLAKAGADLDARDVTGCTPLQNAAHGTYSAMADMSSLNKSQGITLNSIAASSVEQMGGKCNLHIAAGDAATFSALSDMSGGSTGLVPVRTGLSWATLAAGAPRGPTPPSSTLPPNFGGGEFFEARRRYLAAHLKKAPRPGLHLDRTQGATKEQRSLVSQQRARQSRREDSTTDVLQQALELKVLNCGQDRGRLIAVVERLVQLGAALSAVDSEGRTALHLAAGCGDEAMVLKLLELGTDINCMDSVGGTAMHHAAVAKKMDIMMMLARLGCDWKARAGGIYDATASLVFCGQQGKSNLAAAQKVMDAKLKKAYMEGVRARQLGLSALPHPQESLAAQHTEAKALANADELLRSEEIKTTLETKKRLKKKKKKVVSPYVDSPIVSDGPSVLSLPVPSGEMTGLEPDMDQGAFSVESSSNFDLEDNSINLQVTGSTESMSASPEKSLLDAACSKAVALDSLCEPREISDCIKDLDVAIAAAERAKVSAKYGKKCRKKLVLALQVLQANSAGGIPQGVKELPSKEDEDIPHGQQDCNSDNSHISWHNDSVYKAKSVSMQRRASLSSDGGDFGLGQQQQGTSADVPVSQIQPPLILATPVSRATQVGIHAAPVVDSNGQPQQWFSKALSVPSPCLQASNVAHESLLRAPSNAFAGQQLQNAAPASVSMVCPSHTCAPMDTLGQPVPHTLSQPAGLPCVQDLPHLPQRQQLDACTHEGAGLWWHPVPCPSLQSPGQLRSDQNSGPGPPEPGRRRDAGSDASNHIFPMNGQPHGGAALPDQRPLLPLFAGFGHVHTGGSDDWQDQAQRQRWSSHTTFSHRPAGDVGGASSEAKKLQCSFGLQLPAEVKEGRGLLLDKLGPREFPRSSVHLHDGGTLYRQCVPPAVSSAPATVLPVDNLNGHADIFRQHGQSLQNMRMRGNILSDIMCSTLQASNRMQDVRLLQAQQAPTAACGFPPGFGGLVKEHRADELENANGAFFTGRAWASHAPLVPLQATPAQVTVDLLDGDAASLLPSDLLMDPSDDGVPRPTGQPSSSRAVRRFSVQQNDCSPASGHIPQQEHAVNPLAGKAAKLWQQASRMEQSSFQAWGRDTFGSGCMHMSPACTQAQPL